jgi:hypothetical protein
MILVVLLNLPKKLIKNQPQVYVIGASSPLPPSFSGSQTPVWEPEKLPAAIY